MFYKQCFILCAVILIMLIVIYKFDANIVITYYYLRYPYLDIIRLSITCHLLLGYKVMLAV